MLCAACGRGTPTQSKTTPHHQPQQGAIALLWCVVTAVHHHHNKHLPNRHHQAHTAHQTLPHTTHTSVCWCDTAGLCGAVIATNPINCVVLALVVVTKRPPSNHTPPMFRPHTHTQPCIAVLCRAVPPPSAHHNHTNTKGTPPTQPPPPTKPSKASVPLVTTHTLHKLKHHRLMATASSSHVCHMCALTLCSLFVHGAA